MKSTRTIFMTESGIMLALAALLSVFPLAKLPYGGSITAASMLPVMLISYRRGWRWGLFTGLAFSLLELLLGLDNLSYATSQWAAIAIILLDYVFAFTVVGLGGVFRRVLPNQGAALAAGTALTCALRYLAHVVSGCTVWAGVSIPSADGLYFSLVYNATYMVPETLVTLVAAIAVSRVLDFRAEAITRAPARRALPPAALACSVLGIAALAAALVADIVLVFSSLQSSDGVFDITLIAAANWPLIGILTAGGAVAFALLALVSHELQKKTAH